MRPPAGLLNLLQAAATAANERPSYRRRVSNEHRHASFTGSAGNVSARSASRTWPVQKTPLHSRDHRPDGQRRRRVVNDYYSDRLFYRGRADAADVPNPRVVWSGGPTRLPGSNLFGKRTGPGTMRIDGHRPRGFRD